MSGHSKWSKIKHKKGAADQKKGQLFSKLSKQITIAARDGGDPGMNFKLRLVMDQAKQVEMPKDNIQRAIDKATNAGADQLESITYEGYGPYGTAFIIEVLTDSRNRATSNIRHILEKHGGTLGQQNSVAWNFEAKGVVFLKKSKNLSELELMIIDSGAEDWEDSPDGLIIYTSPTQISEIQDKLEKKGGTVENSEIVMIAKNKVTLSNEQKEKVQTLFDALSEDEDVINVYTSAEL
jgi:YebC/PmpR family DNA-binding regulatory protein